MAYKAEFSERAEKDLQKMDKFQAKLIYNWVAKNLDGCENPRKHGKALAENLKGLWRYRVGSYRVVCEIRDNELVVIAISIGHRREVYR